MHERGRPAVDQIRSKKQILVAARP